MKTQPIQTIQIPQIELCYRDPRKVSELPKINSSSEAYEVLRQSWDENKIELQEQTKVLLISRSNRCLGVSTLSTGGTSGTVVDFKLIFALALKSNAHSIIVSHNHPSGVLQFSEEDKLLTQNLVNIGEAMGVSILDHLVVTKEGFISMSDTNTLPYAKKLDNTSFANEPEPQDVNPKGSENKPAYYIFKPNTNGEKPIGAIFTHSKGNGLSIVFNGERFPAFPPRQKKPVSEPEQAKPVEVKAKRKSASPKNA